MTIKVRKDRYGETWPFLVKEGELYCYVIKGRIPLYAAIFKAEQVEYALNGIAVVRGYPRIDPIWKEGLQPGTKRDLGPFINIALRRRKNSEETKTK